MCAYGKACGLVDDLPHMKQEMRIYSAVVAIIWIAVGSFSPWPTWSRKANSPLWKAAARDFVLVFGRKIIRLYPMMVAATIPSRD